MSELHKKPKQIYNSHCTKYNLLKCIKKGNNKKINYDNENFDKLNETVDSIDIEEKNVTKKIRIFEKIHFTLLIFIGIIFILHIIHFIFSDYVRKLFNNNNL